MRNWVLPLMAFGLLAASTRAGDEKGAAADREQLQGEWRVVAAEAEGEKAAADFLKACRVVVKDDTITFFVGEQKTEHRFKLEPAKGPKAIDLEQLNGDDKGKTMSGIYAVEKGRLRLCLPVRAGTGTGRPKEFKTEAGDSLGAITLEPAKAR